MRTSLYPNRSRSAYGLLELLISAGMGFVVLTGAIVVFIYGIFSFAGLGNYAILTGQSRVAADAMSREMREATGILSAQSTGNTKTLVFTNSFTRTITAYAWNADTGILTCQRTGEDAPRVRLTGCDLWDFTLFQRTPQTNWYFFTTADLKLCKSIDMTWKCSRSILGQKINTENIVTAQVVLRNKP